MVLHRKEADAAGCAALPEQGDASYYRRLLVEVINAYIDTPLDEMLGDDLFQEVARALGWEEGEARQRVHQK